MQSVGPKRVASLAQAMGVRQSKLDVVLSLALGTSPVTLKEMVASYSTIANNGAYIEPLLVTRVTDRKGKLLASFQAKAPEQAISLASAQILVDAMRGVVDRGTGTGIRSRFGIQADVAGKTGTTQDNTDGWFILMHPQLVAGAWVGFNDNRVTMGDGWGQGARSALPMVGDFFSQTLRTRAVDAQASFDAPRTSGRAETLGEQVSDWFNALFPPAAPPARQEQPSPIYSPPPFTPPYTPPYTPPFSPPPAPGADQRWEPIPGARPAPTPGSVLQPQPVQPSNQRYPTPGVVIGLPRGEPAP